MGTTEAIIILLFLIPTVLAIKLGISNKPKKLWIAIALSFFAGPIGHIYLIKGAWKYVIAMGAAYVLLKKLFGGADGWLFTAFLSALVMWWRFLRFQKQEVI